MQASRTKEASSRAFPRLSLKSLVIATAAVIAVCTAPVRAQTCEDPKVLRFSIIPTQETVRELTLYKPVVDLLAKNTGKKIEFYMPTSYASVVEALMGKWVDVAVLGPESYVIAHNKDKTIEVFATYYKKKIGVQEAGPGYKSLLISKKGSKFTTIESAKGSVMLLVDPASTSGALIPEAVFAKKVVNMPLKDYFSRVAFSGGHDLSTFAIADCKADVAFVESHRFLNTV
jgi:phosphonate transport system substrate-binding protein